MLPNEHPVLVTGATSGISGHDPPSPCQQRRGCGIGPDFSRLDEAAPMTAPGDCSACDST
jgi:hypothetical protein